MGSYRTTLNARAVMTDEGEQNSVLNACHQRCADRTLKVLEKNGGIFIKLGQHLVRRTPDRRPRIYTNRLPECHELSPAIRMDNNVHTFTRQMSRIVVRVD